MPRIQPIPWDELKPKSREMIEAGMKSGGFTDPLPVQILAYADHDVAPEDGDRHPNFPKHLLPGKLLEMLRIRSAQLGGCAPCSRSRKVEGATEEVVACLIDPSQRGELSEHERLALEFLELLATDHHKIGDELYCRLAQHFTIAEIVELGSTCAHMIGTHRFMHTLDVLSDNAPVITYDPAEVGVSWAQRHPDQPRPDKVPNKRGRAA
jgi:alkylhydroperoxidase family enzyme